MSVATLVVELVTEELPPKALKMLGEAFADVLVTYLRDQAFLGADSVVTSFATPRRLAVAITAVRSVAPDKAFKEKLLPVSVAFDAAGKPTPALLGKLKARQLSHVDSQSLLREHDGKVEALYYSGVAKGGPLVSALQTALDDAIDKLPIPKVMSYASAGHYYNNEKFVRPAHRLLALHGAEIVNVSALGLDAGRTTDGHRFLSRGAIDISSAEAYAPTLEAEGKVIPSFAARHAHIVVALEGAAGDATPIMPDTLLDEVTALVEWPVVYAGSFDPDFLGVPQECLILTMQLNQRYFALADDSGKLVNRFLLVSNLETRDPTAIVAGNERVLRARLADAKFFFDQDRKQRLETRVGRLASVVHHNKLGTQAERVDRLRFLATRIAPLIGADADQADRAALLAKADLVTDMVGEFPELQGVMGRYYAQHDGEAPAVAAAIEQHYWPKVAGGQLPETALAQTVALADKLETLAGLFGIGQVPTGDKDPFGLRRAALGVLRIIIEKRLPLLMHDITNLAFAAHASNPAVQDAHTDLELFMYERLRGYLRDRGYSTDEVAAVLDWNPSDLWLIPDLLAAVQAFESMPEAKPLAAANKRIRNILKKNGIFVIPGPGGPITINRLLMTSSAERELASLFDELGPKVETFRKAGDWTSALKILASARPVVDQFFDEVMVEADDPAVKENRLELLRSIAQTMNRVADISKLAQ